MLEKVLALILFSACRAFGICLFLMASISFFYVPASFNLVALMLSAFLLLILSAILDKLFLQEDKDKK